MNLFSVIATVAAGWFLFGRTRLNCQRGNKPKNRLPLTDYSNEPEYLQIFIIVLDINNIMCYITMPKHGEWYDENNTRYQKYFSKAQKTAAKRSLRSISVWYNRTFFCKNS